MAVRLHTFDGKTKVYPTHRGEGGGENGPDKYVTKCGMEWTIAPETYQTCDHIDCALDVQRRAADSGPAVFSLCVVVGFIAFLYLMKNGGIWALGFFILMGLWILIGGIKSGDRFNELTEYKRKGTINGMRAYAAPAIEELTELKTAKKCLECGLAFYDQGKYDDALKALDKAIELNPSITTAYTAWIRKGSMLNAQMKYGEAIAAYDKAIVLNPKLADAWYNKGLTLGNLGKYDEAIQAFNKAIEIDPKNVDFGFNKGMALRSLGRTAEADATFTHAKSELNSKGNDLFHCERYAEAIKAYDMALAADPEYVNAWINKGTAFFRLGRYYEAIRAFNQVIEIDPQNADAWNRKGVVLKKMSRTVEADDAFAKAKELGYTG